MTFVARLLASAVLVITGIVALLGGLLREDPEGQGFPADAAARASTNANDTDAMFAQMMVPHDSQALSIVRLASTRAVDPELKILAAAIGATQLPEAASMAAWLRLWRRPLTVAADAHAAHGGAPGITPRELAAIRDSRGAEFDRRFLHMMIAHQDDAIQMARRELYGGRSVQALILAARIEQSRLAQIELMIAMLERLP